MLLLVGACEPTPESGALARFSDRSRTLAEERPFRRPAGPRPEGEPAGTCPDTLDDVASGTTVTLRGTALVTDRRRIGRTETVTRWQRGYYVPASPAAVGLAPGEEYIIRCDRMAGTGVNVPDVRPAP